MERYTGHLRHTPFQYETSDGKEVLGGFDCAPGLIDLIDLIDPDKLPVVIRPGTLTPFGTA